MKIQLAMSIYICLMNYLYVSVKTKVQTLKRKILKDKREKSRIEALKKKGRRYIVSIYCQSCTQKSELKVIFTHFEVI